jgi:hypothetical protein
MSKSVVDATLMRSDWPAVVAAIEQQVIPADIARVIDGYLKRIMDVYEDRKAIHDKFKSAQLPPGASENKATCTASRPVS